MLVSDAELLRSGSKFKALEELRERHERRNELIKRLIIDHDRRDLFATLLAGYYVYDSHQLLIDWNQAHAEFNLMLAFRDLGKTTIGTINDAACEIVQDRDVRILIGSKTDSNARSFLKELKAKLRRPQVEEVFGPFYNMNNWNQTEIEVLGREIESKEPTVKALGVESTVTSQHYDIIYGDDLVSRDNSRTETQRSTVKDFLYSTLDPCLEPTGYRPGRVCGFRLRGTHYHPDDLYQDIIDNDERFDGHVAIIPAVQEDGVTSNFPEKFSDAYFAQKRRLGMLYFGPQYLLDTTFMKGDVFDYSTFKWTNTLPPLDTLKIWVGVDLAISLTERADFFAIVTVGQDESGNTYLLHFYTNRLVPSKVNEVIARVVDRFDPIRVGIESNQYQAAKLYELKDDERYRHIPTVAVPSHKDKETRARTHLSPAFENGEFYFYTGVDTGDFEEQLVHFPKKPNDLVDAAVIAMTLAGKSRKRKRSKRVNEPGVL